MLPVVSSFQKSRESLGFPPRDPQTMQHQAGNSMDTHVIGAALLWLFSIAEAPTAREESSEYFSQCLRARRLGRPLSDPSDKRARTASNRTAGV